MVAYVSGNSLGWINGSAGVLGNAGQVGDASTGTTGENVLVNAATGNLILSHRDEYLSGLGLDLPILRTYNSQGLMNDDNGDNWLLGYARTISSLTGTANMAGSTVIRTYEDGAAIVYTYDSTSGKYVSDAGPGARDTLSYNAGADSWTWTDGDTQTTELYTGIVAGGRLQSITDHNQNTVTLTWTGNLITRITNADGEYVSLVYDTAAGHTANLVQVNTYAKTLATDATATLRNRVYYGYDSSNRLTSVTVDLTPTDNSISDGKVYTTLYTYDGTSDRVASIKQTDGSELRFNYDPNDLVTHRLLSIDDVRSSTDVRTTTLTYGANQTTTITTTARNPVTNVTSPLTQSVTMQYDAVTGQLKKLTQPGIGDTKYDYDANGNVIQVTDPKLNITVYGYDGQDNRIYERDAAGNTISRTYSSTNQLLTETRYRAADPDGAGSQTASLPETTRYVYDVKGNLRFAVSPDGRVTEYRYYPNGLLKNQISYTGNQFDIDAALASSSQDFSVDTSGLSIPAAATSGGYMVWSNGALNVVRQNAASAISYATYGTTYYPLGTTFSADVTTDSSTQRYLQVGAQNGGSGTATRRMLAHFSGNTLYASYCLSDGTVATTSLTSSIKANTTYTVEVVTGTSGATLYVYEKGKTRADGFTYTQTIDGWDQARWRFNANGDPSVTAPTTMIVDNLVTTGLTSTQNFAVDTSGLTIVAADQTAGYFNVQGSLNVARRYADTTTGQSIFGSTNYAPGTGFHAEIVTDASTNRYFMIGAQNGGSGSTARRMMAYLSGNNLYANYLDSSGNSLNTLLLSNVKANTNYVVEVDTSSTGATLYVFEKGKTRADGVTYSQTVSGWTQARWMITTQNDNTVTAPSTIAVDLLSTSTGDSQNFAVDTAGLTISSTQQAQGAFALNKTLNATSQNGASVVAHRVFGSSYQAIGTEFAADVIADASTQRYAMVGIDNGQTSGVGARRMTAYFSGNVIYANYFDAAGTNISTRIGTVQANTEYMVEVQTSADGATVYVYPKGQTRASGMSFTQTIDGWSQARWFIQTKSDPAITAGSPTTLAINSLSTSTPATGLTEVALSNWVAQQDLTQTQRIDTSYDFRGQVATVARYTATDAAGAGIVDGTQSSTAFVYNAWGELVQTVDARGVATTGTTGAPASDYLTAYTYDGLGRMLTQTRTDATGAVITLSSTAYNDPARQSTVTLRNPANNVAIGASTVSTYDQGGHLVSVVQIDNGTSAEMSHTDYVVDVLGRTVAKRVTAGGTVLSSYVLYDSNNRKVADIDATGALTEYVYNAGSQVVKTIAYATPVAVSASADPSLLTLDGTNPLRPAATANDRITRSLYDAAGHLVKTIDADGAVIQYQYDGRGQLVQTTAYANRLTGTQLTALAATNGDIAPTDANTVPVTDAANDRTTRSFYSDDGQLLGTLDAEGYFTEYRYDGAGQRVQSIQYATLTNASLRVTATDLGQLRPLANASDITATTLYNDEGQVTGTIDGEGYLTETQYDAAGNVAATIRYANQVTTTSVIGATVASVRPATSSADHQVTNQYDTFNRVTQTTSLPDNLVTTYQYDATGNLISVTASPGTNQRQDLKRYDALGRVTSELSGENAAKITVGMTQAQIDAIWTGYATRYTYDEGGVLTSVTDPIGRKTLYYYDNDGRLAYTINPMGEVSFTKYDAFGGKTEFWQYTARVPSGTLSGMTGGYQTAAFTTAISGILSSGIRKSRETYTLRGQIANAFDANDTNIEQRHYNAFGELDQDSLLIAAAGPMRVDTFAYDQLGNLVTEQDDVNVANAVTTNVYDAFGRLTKSTGPTGVITNATYDRLGRTVTTSIGSGTTIANKTIAYDAFGRTLSLITSDGTTTYSYDDVNRKLTVTTPLGIATSQTHNEFGETITVTDGRGNTTTYFYNDDGQVWKVTDPAGIVLTTFDPAGQVTQTTDKNGIATTYGYDAAGRVLTTTFDPTGLNITTRTCYDALGEAIWQQDGNRTWTRTDYDLNGRVTAVSVDPAQVPDQTQLPGALVLVANPNTTPLNLQTTYTYDPAGDVLTVTEGYGSSNPKTTQYTYDNLRRRTKEVIDPSGLAITTQYSHDDAGNLVQKTDANGNKSYYAYDVYGRQTVTVDAAGSVTQTVYDSLNRVVQVKQYKDVLSATTLATLPAITSTGTRKDADILALLPNGSSNTNCLVTQTLYNADGQQQYVIDAAGDVTLYGYDNSGNVNKVTRYAKPVTPGNGITGLTADAANDQVTQFVWDSANRLVYTVDAAGYVTKQQYDQAGHVVKTSAYANAYTGSITMAALQAAYAADGVNDRITHYIFDAAGRLSGTIDAVGNVTLTQYDNTDNVIAVTAYAKPIAIAGLPIITQWSNVTLTTDPADRVTRHVVDAGGRMRYTIDALGNVTYNCYDALGRVKSTKHYANPITGTPPTTLSGMDTAVAAIADANLDQTDTFTYDAAGRLTGSTDALSHTESYGYDALGNKTSFTNKNGSTWTYEYDNVGRLTKETSPTINITTVGDVSGAVAVTGTSTNVALVTVMQYDALGNLTSRTEAFGRPEARTTQYQYDNLGRQVKTIFPKVAIYDAATDSTANLTNASDQGSVARVEVTRDPNAATPNPLFSQVFYDAFGNAVANIDVSGNISLKAYDKLGQVKYDVDATGCVTQYDRNAFGEVTTLTRYANTTSTPTSSLIPASIIKASDAPNAAVIAAAISVNVNNDRKLTTSYDALGRAILVTEPSTYVWDPATNAYFASVGKQTKTAYDAFGNATRIDVSWTPTTWTTTHQYFDKLNRQTATVDALNYLTKNTYDAFGNLTATTEYAKAATGVTDTNYTAPTADAKDRTTNYVYDRLNRKTSETRVNVQYSTASDGTSTTGNAVTSYGYDNIGNQTSVTDALSNTTYTYYDAVGHITAVAAPARNIGAATTAKSPLTTFLRDAYGNVVVKTDYATGVTATGGAAPTATADPANDRTTYTLYDAMGHAIETTDANGNTQYSSYDAAGNLAKQWYRVTDNNGVIPALRTLFTVYQYDKLGRQIGVITPNANAVAPGTGVANPIATFTSSTATAPQNPPPLYNGTNTITLTWNSSFIDSTGGQVQVSVAYVGGASPGGTKVQTGTAASAATGMTISWTDSNNPNGGINNLSTIVISQQNAAGQWIVKWAGSGTQAAAGQVNVQTQKQAGVALTQSVYNAFGEMVSQQLSTVSSAGVTTSTEAAQTWDYDVAGRVWRTNAGDGVTKVILYDLQGHAVSQIVSNGVQYDTASSNPYQATATTDAGFNLMSMSSAQQTVSTILVSPDLVSRTDTWYDALGHQVKQVQAARTDKNPGVTVQRSYIFANVQSILPANYNKYINSATLSWSPLDTLGNGDVLAMVEYAMSDGSRTTVSKIIPAGQAQSGVSFSSESTIAATAVTHVWLYKTDGGDTQQLVYERTAFGYNNDVGLYIRDPDAAADADAAATTFTVKYWQGANAPLSMTPTRFGEVWRASLTNLNGSGYNYEVWASRGGQAAVLTDSGTFSLNAPVEQPISGLAFAQGGNGASIYTWASPGASVTQMFNYRVAGSNGAWQSLTVSSRSGGYDGVDTSVLASGTYEYELLWTNTNDTAPYAHALGQFTVYPPAISATITTANSTSGATLSWTWAYNGGTQTVGNGVLNYRASGSSGNWSTVALTQTVIYGNGNNQAPTAVTYSTNLGAWAAGSYDTEILFTASGNSAPTARSTGTLTVGTSQVWIPGTPASTTLGMSSTASGVSNVALSGSTVSWRHTYTGASGTTPSLKYRVQGTTTWTTINASVTNVGVPPQYLDYSVTLPALAANTYDIQLYSQYGLDGSGTLTVTAATAGYYVTRGTSATFADTTASASRYVASPTANPTTSIVSLPSGSLVLTQTKTLDSGTTSLRPVITQTVDRWGNVTKITDARMASWITDYEYNANNQMIKEIQPDGNGVEGAGPTSYWYYDKLGRQVATRDARTQVGVITTTTSGGVTSVAASTSAISGNVNGYVYDAGGNLVQEIHADGGVVQHQYDAFGDETKQTDANNVVTLYTYDRLGHRITVTYAAFNVYSTGVNGTTGNDQITLVGSQQLVETMAYDEAGRLKSKTGVVGSATTDSESYRYDSKGNVIQSTVNGIVTTDAWDNHQRKIAEVDANGNKQTWTYNAFHLTAHTDLGGATTTYAYDNAGRLFWQVSTRGQNLSYAYDGAGQLIRIYDSAINQVTTYAWDLAGHHVREKTAQGSGIYQDDFLGYDTLGRLRYVGNDSASINIDYDEAGNRSHVKTHRYLNTPDANGNFISDDDDRYFLYDAMNRQVLVDGVRGGSAGNYTYAINSTQGHELTYDYVGNRKSDARIDNRWNGSSAVSGTVIENYTYDAANRLTVTTRNDTSSGAAGTTTLDNRYYNAAGQVVQSGVTTLNAAYATGLKLDNEIHNTRYDGVNKRLSHQGSYKAGGIKDTLIEYNGGDLAGNMLGYVVTGYDTTASGNPQTYSYTTSITMAKYDAYKEIQESSVGGGFKPGTTTSTYDVNGNLTGITDSAQSGNNRTFVNDVNGNVLYVNQGGHIQHQMIVNGEVLGKYGEQADPSTSPTSSPSFTDKTDFGFGYQPINGNYPGPAPGIYRVSSGDTLQDIAQGAYGDSSLWYNIAEANGIESNNDLRIGQALTIPTKTAGVHNTGGTFKAYDGSVRGSTSPALQVVPPIQPNNDDCGAMGQIIATIVVVICTTIGSYGGPWGAAAGNAVGQRINMWLGLQDHIDWSSVALAGIGEGVSEEINAPPIASGAAGGAPSAADTAAMEAFRSTPQVMLRAAEANAITQGIGVVLGLQDHFNWVGVVASAVGAGVGNEVGGVVANKLGQNPASKFVTGVVSGFAAGATTSILGGGRISTAQVVADAFGNALAAGFADQSKQVANGQQGEKQQDARQSPQAAQASSTTNDAVSCGDGADGGNICYAPTGQPSVAIQAIPPSTVVPGLLNFGENSSGDGTPSHTIVEVGQDDQGNPKFTVIGRKQSQLPASATYHLPPIDTSGYILPGLFKRRFDSAAAMLANSNSPWYERGVSLVLGTAIAPMMLVEEVGRGIMNVPADARIAAQLWARADMTHSHENAVQDRLRAVVHMTSAFNNAAGAGAMGATGVVENMAVNRMTAQNAAARASYGELGAQESAGAVPAETSSFASVYAKAPAAKAEIDAMADDIASKFDGATVAKAPIKSEARAMQKMNDNPWIAGNPTLLNDLARNTIVVSPSQVDAVAAELTRRGADVRVIAPNSNPLGYSGVNSTIPTNAGILGEIQVNTPAMIFAKEPETVARGIIGDASYNQIAARTSVPGGLGHQFYEQYRVLSPIDPQAGAIAAQSREYYNIVRMQNGG